MEKLNCYNGNYGFTMENGNTYFGIVKNITKHTITILNTDSTTDYDGIENYSKELLFKNEIVEYFKIN